MKHVDYFTFGEAVLRVRRRRRMLQRELATRVGVSPSYISNIEHGHADPSYTVIVSICAILDIAEPDDLPEEGGEI